MAAQGNNRRIGIPLCGTCAKQDAGFEYHLFKIGYSLMFSCQFVSIFSVPLMLILSLTSQLDNTLMELTRKRFTLPKLTVESFLCS